MRRADAEIDRWLESYGVEVVRGARLTAVNPRERTVSTTGPDGDRTIPDVTVAMSCRPTGRPAGWPPAGSLSRRRGGQPRWGWSTRGWSTRGLVDAGLVDIGPETLRHRRHPAIWAIGDAAAVRTRPSGGALRPPVTVSRQRLLLVETDRAGQPQPSVPVVDLLKPRRSTWLVDRYVLPVLYFRRILRGRV